MSTGWTEIVSKGQRYENSLGQPRWADKAGLLVRVPMLMGVEELIEAICRLGYRRPKRRHPGEASEKGEAAP